MNNLVVSPVSSYRALSAKYKAGRGLIDSEDAPRKDVDELLPVGLEDKELSSDYSGIFFANPKKPKRGHITTGLDFYELGKYITEVAKTLSGVQGALREMYVSAANAEDGVLTGNNPGGYLADKFANYASFITDAMSVNFTRRFMISMMNGGQHTIVPSKRFPGGFDVVFSGTPPADVVQNPGDPQTGPVVFKNFKARSTYVNFQRAKWEESQAQIKAGRVALAMANAFYKGIFNEDVTAPSSGGSRVVKEVPLNFNFNAVLKSMSSVFQSEYGVSIESDLAIKFDKLDHLIKSLGKYFSLTVIREANRQTVNALSSNPSLDQAEFPSMPTMAFTTDLTVSFKMHLPKELCEFITQTSNKPVSLVSLNTWINAWTRMRLRPAGERIKKAKGAGRDPASSKLNVKACPRYILPVTSLTELVDNRKAMGYYAEPGKSNEDRLFVAKNGRMNWCPNADELILDNARGYEERMEEMLRISFEAGAPITGGAGIADKVFALKSPDYAAKIPELKTKLAKYGGSLQGFNWDYNCALYSGKASPDTLVSHSLAGAVKADERSAAEILRTPFLKAIGLMFPEIDVKNPDGSIEGLKNLDDYHYGIKNIINTSPFRGFATAYAYLLYQGKAPTFQELVADAAKEMGFATLDPASSEDTDAPVKYEDGLYKHLFDNSLRVLGKYQKDPKELTFTSYDPAKIPNKYGANDQAEGILSALSQALADATRTRSPCNLVKVVLATAGSLDEDAIKDDSHFMNPSEFNTNEFNRVYNYLGGRIFQKACAVIAKADPKSLVVVDPECPLPTVPFRDLSTEVLPACVMFGKYVPAHEAILKKSDEMMERNELDDSITPDDIKFPGSTADFKLFPHQFESMQRLVKHPKYAVLDVAPGGGKTVLLLADIAQLIHEKKINRACVICPDNLMKNWVEDLHKASVTAGRWNVIPINLRTYRFWRERLTELIKKAPRNTIYVIGIDFFKAEAYPIVIGSHVEKTSAGVEFIRMFGFDYVAIDESHRIKNPGTGRHIMVRQIATASVVKYIRIASGSLISNRVVDIVGQSAVLNPQIFRTQKEFKEENNKKLENGATLQMLESGRAKATRERLSKYAAVMTYKRKDWAFLLPEPLETFIRVGLSKEEEIDAEGNKRDDAYVDSEIGNAHQAMYETLLQESMEEMMKDPNVQDIIRRGKKSAEDDDEDEDDDSDNDSDGDSDNDVVGGAPKLGGLDKVALTDDAMEELEVFLRAYLQRLEMFLIDPMGDEFTKEFYERSGERTKHIVSNKVIAAIKRIRLNFTPKPWERGAAYSLRDYADYQDFRYILVGNKDTKLVTDAQGHKLYKSDITPDQDPAWKKEKFGKVIVFCRYTRSTKAVYDALPPDLKKMAVMFHGGIHDRYDKMDKFKKDPFSFTTGAQILVANEMAISEGHNLQMASRMIRMESPWAPGELDQAQSRIFRPDPSKQYTRENVYLDHIIANRTMEIAKYAKLLQKIMEKAQFDEADNKNYDEIMEYEIPPMENSINMFKEIFDFSQIEEQYLAPYQHYVSIQGMEFKEMRAKKGADMISIPETPMFEDAAILEQVPYLPGLAIPDRHDWKLTNLLDLVNTDDPRLQEALAANGIKGLYAHTEIGNGIIEAVKYSKSRTKTAEDEEDGLEEETTAQGRITSVTVRLVNGDTYESKPNLIWVTTDPNMSEETIKQFSPEKPVATPRDKREAERRDRAAKKATDLEEARLKKQRLKEKKAIERLKRLGKKGVPTSPDADSDDEDAVVDSSAQLQVFPVVYNSWWALEAVPVDAAGNVVDLDSMDLSKHGFKTYGDYAWIHVRDHKSFVAIRKFLEASYAFDADTIKRLDYISVAFQGPGKPFIAELFPVSQIPRFYMQAHQKSGIDPKTKKPMVRVWPAVMANGLLLNIDIYKNPAILKVLRKPIIGATAAGKDLAKFQRATGQYIAFFKSRMQVWDMVKQLKREGIVITNMDEFKERMPKLRAMMTQTG